MKQWIWTYGEISELNVSLYSRILRISQNIQGGSVCRRKDFPQTLKSHWRDGSRAMIWCKNPLETDRWWCPVAKPSFVQEVPQSAAVPCHGECRFGTLIIKHIDFTREKVAYDPQKHEKIMGFGRFCRKHIPFVGAQGLHWVARLADPLKREMMDSRNFDWFIKTKNVINPIHTCVYIYIYNIYCIYIYIYTHVYCIYIYTYDVYKQSQHHNFCGRYKPSPDGRFIFELHT